MVNGCISGCERNPTLPMCRLCVKVLSAPFGSSYRQYVESTTRFSRSKASPHGKKGTLRQKFQNKTWKYMRVRPVRMGYNWALLNLKRIHGESRWEEATLISMARDQAKLLKPSCYSEVWDQAHVNADGTQGAWKRQG